MGPQQAKRLGLFAPGGGGQRRSSGRNMTLMPGSRSEGRKNTIQPTESDSSYWQITPIFR